MIKILTIIKDYFVCKLKWWTLKDAAYKWKKLYTYRDMIQIENGKKVKSPSGKIVFDPYGHYIFVCGILKDMKQPGSIDIQTPSGHFIHIEWR